MKPTAITLSLALCAWSSTGWGQPSSPAEEARRRFERGVSLLDATRWSDAVFELEAARALAPTPAVMFNLGLAYRALGRVREASVAFREFLRLGGEHLPSERRAEVERYLTELSSSVARVAFQLDPPTARVSLDGVALDPATTEYEIDPGAHTMVVLGEGHEPLTQGLTVRSGERLSLVLRLTPTPTPPPAPPRVEPAPATTREAAPRAYRDALVAGALVRWVPDDDEFLGGFSGRFSLRFAHHHEAVAELGLLQAPNGVNLAMGAAGYYWVGGRDLGLRPYVGAALAATLLTHRPEGYST